MPRLTFIALMVMLAGIGAGSPAHSVECTCPTIAADGVGNSSCSASESNNRCKVDFNEFGEREQMAVDALSKAGLKLQPLSPTQDFHQALLANLDEGTIFDTLSVYLNVAAVQQNASATQLTAVLDVANQFRNQILSAFSQDARQLMNQPGPMPPGQTQILEQNPAIVVSPGCVEISASGLWVMYKAYWAMARDAERCGGLALRP